MKAGALALLFVCALGACGPSDTTPVSAPRSCRFDADCGKLRYCSPANVCRQDCVVDAHCIGPGGGPQCNSVGRCVPPASSAEPDGSTPDGGEKDGAPDSAGYYITPKTPAVGAPVPRLQPPMEVVVPGALLLRPKTGQRFAIPRARLTRVLADGTELWQLPATATVAETIAARDALTADGVEVELDVYRKAHGVRPGDEGFPKQWALKQLQMEAAWSVTIGDPELVVAIVDTGYVDHPEMAGRLVPGYDFISDPANAGDGDGRDAVPLDAGTESLSSSSFHGVHIAGIIGAATDNGVGMAGIDWSCRMQPVRVLGVKQHRGRDSDIADAIRWAAGLAVPGVPRNATPARVINLSFGAPGYSQLLQDAIRAAVDHGALVIASAGNSADEASTNVPGSLEGVVSVAASQPDGNIASYSNFGVRVDFMAPGGAVFIDAPIAADTPAAIWSTSYLREGSQPVFAFAAGTSQAAAHASGVAALVRAVAPGLPPEVVAAVMRRASVLPKDGCAKGCGDGLLDASRAVSYARDIAIAMCGTAGCGGTNRVRPAVLRQEEGCSVGAVGRTGGSATLLLVLLVGLRKRRAMLAILLAGCVAGDGEREGQSAAGPVVKIVDPVPTYDLGQLRLSVPASGRELTATVTPDDGIVQVELRVLEPDLVIGRLGHAPYKFDLPAWVAKGEGGRTVCVTALDSRARTGEICFLAVAGSP